MFHWKTWKFVCFWQFHAKQCKCGKLFGIFVQPDANLLIIRWFPCKAMDPYACKARCPCRFNSSAKRRETWDSTTRVNILRCETQCFNIRMHQKPAKVIVLRSERSESAANNDILRSSHHMSDFKWHRKIINWTSQICRNCGMSSKCILYLSQLSQMIVQYSPHLLTVALCPDECPSVSDVLLHSCKGRDPQERESNGMNVRSLEVSYIILATAGLQLDIAA